MASRKFDGLNTLGQGLVELNGSFAPNGSSAVSASSRQGRGWSVARTGAGAFTITLSDKYTTLVAASFHLQFNAATALIPQMIAETVATTKTITFRLIDTSATPTDVAANANNRVHFRFILRNSGVGPVRG